MRGGFARGGRPNGSYRLVVNVSGGSISASVAIQEGLDAVAASAGVDIGASVAIQEGLDAVAASVTVSGGAVSASVAIQEGVDAVASDATTDPILGGRVIKRERGRGTAAARRRREAEEAQGAAQDAEAAQEVAPVLDLLPPTGERWHPQGGLTKVWAGPEADALVKALDPPLEAQQFNRELFGEFLTDAALSAANAVALADQMAVAEDEEDVEMLLLTL
jgi:hypothetical protein